MRQTTALLLIALIALAAAAPSSAQPPPARVHLPLVTHRPISDPDLAAIAEAASGLRYPSESDYPLDPFLWPHGLFVHPAAVCERLAELRGQPLELRGFYATFQRLAAAPPEASPQELEQAQGFARLRDAILARLEAPTVCRIGEIRISVLILGVSGQGYVVGLQTTSIET